MSICHVISLPARKVTAFARFAYTILRGGRNETENTIPSMIVKTFGSDQTTVCSPWACARVLALYVARVVGLFSLVRAHLWIL